MSPKVIQVLDTRNFGGLETHVLLLSIALSNQSLDVHVLFLNNYGHHPLFTELKNNNISYHILDGKISSLVNYLKTHSPCLIHTHGYKPSILCKLISKWLNLPIVSTYHSGEKVSGRLALYRWADDKLSFLSTNIAVSEPIAKNLYSKNTFVIPNFVQLPQEIRPEPNEPQIVFVGRLSYEKGPDLFCQLSRHIPNVEFHVYGDGPMREDLQLYSNTVRFHGYVQDVFKIWQNATLLCITSRDEGLPLVALEAMSHGVPVISYAVGGLTSLIQNNCNGFLINPEDSDGMKDCIKHYLSLEKKQKELLQGRARKTIEEHYSEEIICEKIIHIYNQYISLFK